MSACELARQYDNHVDNAYLLRDLPVILLVEQETGGGFQVGKLAIGPHQGPDHW
jgi:hypothetical protein